MGVSNLQSSPTPLAYARIDYAPGTNITINNTAWTAVSGTALDLAVPAAVGDLIEYAPNFGLENQAVYVYFDVLSVNSGRYLSSGTTTADSLGQLGWRTIASTFDRVSGSIFRKLTSDDISTGSVKTRLMFRSDTATNRVIYAGNPAGAVLRLALINHGQAA